jgi:hypothetical protein
MLLPLYCAWTFLVSFFQLAQASRPLSERLSLFWADFIVIFKNMLNYIIEHAARLFQLVRTQSGMCAFVPITASVRALFSVPM